MIFDRRDETHLSKAPRAVLSNRPIMPWVATFRRWVGVMYFGPNKPACFPQPDGSTRKFGLEPFADFLSVFRQFGTGKGAWRSVHQFGGR